MGEMGKKLGEMGNGNTPSKHASLAGHRCMWTVRKGKVESRE
jgi:hypothetical protein